MACLIHLQPNWEGNLNKETIEQVFVPLKDKALTDLTRLVNTSSFTEHMGGLVAAGDVIMDIADQNGLKLEKIPASGASKGAFHLGFGTTQEQPFFGIIGHFDTVHPPDSPFSQLSDNGDTLMGPGVQDMKSGIVAAIYALRVAREAMGVTQLPVKILFNCDEETGSVDSRPLIETLMKGARAAFIFEGRNATDNALVTSRKGIIMGNMIVKGKAAHAGEAPQDGASAVIEAAHKILALDALTNLSDGIVVTTGKVSGGKVANQIADHCLSSIDIRFKTKAQETALRKTIKSIMETTHVAGCTTEYTLNTARPPFVKNSEIEILRQQYADAAAELGIQVFEREGGGGSDGNLTGAMGICTIDGVGAAGGFPHTDREYIQKASFFDAIKIFALLLTRMLTSKA